MTLNAFERFADGTLDVPRLWYPYLVFSRVTNSLLTY